MTLQRGAEGAAPPASSPPGAAGREAVAFANLVLSGLSSGIGGMSSFATLTHALANGLTRVVARPGALLHGEWVAPLLLAEMRLERFGDAEIRRVEALFSAWDLPRDAPALEARHGAPIPRGAWEEAVAYALSPGETAALARSRHEPRGILAALGLTPQGLATE